MERAWPSIPAIEQHYESIVREYQGSSNVVMSAKHRALAQDLRAGPTSALERLRLLWLQRPSGVLSPDCELIDALSVLAERFVNPDEIEKWKGLMPNIDHIGADLWAACVKCDLLGLLIDMVTSEGLMTQPRVSTSVLDMISDFHEWALKSRYRLFTAMFYHASPR